MTGRTTVTALDHGTHGWRTTVGPNPMGIDRDPDLRARQSRDRQSERAARLAAMSASDKSRATRRANRDRKRWTPEPGDSAMVDWLCYSAVTTD